MNRCLGLKLSKERLQGRFLFYGALLDIVNDVLLPQGRYPENFLLKSQLEVCQEGGSRRGILGGR